jgi:hypothetical protein
MYHVLTYRKCLLALPQDPVTFCRATLPLISTLICALNYTDSLTQVSIGSCLRWHNTTVPDGGKQGIPRGASPRLVRHSGGCWKVSGGFTPRAASSSSMSSAHRWPPAGGGAIAASERAPDCAGTFAGTLCWLG